MKKKEWKSPDKMLMQSGVKVFDQQCNFIGVGNVYSDVQTSTYLRPEDERLCNGQIFPPVQLQTSDVAHFYGLSIPDEVIDRARKLANENAGIIMYAFFHRLRRENTHGLREKILDCVIFSTRDHFFLDGSVVNKRSGYRIMAAVLPYIVEVKQ